jgi:oxygen-independent coproporphyrinogen-3 oxidase
MYGIPYQTVESFGYTLDFVSELLPEHISAYCLKIEEGTPFGKMRETLSLPSEDDEYDMYVLCTEALQKSGYHKYEISNFSRDGYESKHNLKYWTQGDYLGFGVAAHSCFAGERFSNSRDIAAYIRGEDITEEKRKIPPKELMAEYIMLRMRLTDGIELADFKARFGVELEAVCGDLDRYISAGYMQKCGSRVAFTDKGIFVSNSILSDILDFD